MKNLKISAVIFDMDGLIIDSEPLWKIAEIETFKEFGFDFTIEMCALTTGMRIDEVVEFWRKKLRMIKLKVYQDTAIVGQCSKSQYINSQRSTMPLSLPLVEV